MQGGQGCRCCRRTAPTVAAAPGPAPAAVRAGAGPVNTRLGRLGRLLQQPAPAARASWCSVLTPLPPAPPPTGPSSPATPHPLCACTCCATGLAPDPCRASAAEMPAQATPATHLFCVEAAKVDARVEGHVLGQQRGEGRRGRRRWGQHVGGRAHPRRETRAVHAAALLHSTPHAPPACRSAPA